MEEKQPKEFRIMFKPTGIVYTLPEAEIQRILKDDHGFNYEVLDKGVHIETPETVQITTTFQQVVEGDEVRGLDQYTYNELKQFAKENGLDTSGKTEVLRERCIAFTEQQAAAQNNEIGNEVVAVEGNEVQDGPQPDNAPAEVQENIPLEPPTESGEYTTPEGLTITVENQVTEENSETEGDNA